MQRSEVEGLMEVTASEIASGATSAGVVATSGDTPMNMLANGNNRISRRAFLHSSIIGVSGLAMAGCVNGVVTRGEIEVTDRAIRLPNLPAAWKGKTVAHLSDIHSSPFMSLSDLKRIVRNTNAVGADVIVMTGDFVTSHRNEIPPFLEAMSELKAPLGVYASTGNHDYYCGVDFISRGMEDIGITMLRNEAKAISIDGQKLHLIGVDDEDDPTIVKYVDGKHAPHMDATFSGLPENSASILLCHKPYRFEQYAQTNIGLMLSGHTHGGQIVFGRFAGTVLSISSVASKFIEGCYTPEASKSGSQLYVSRGLGTVGLPIRINCPPEIVKITLV